MSIRDAILADLTPEQREAVTHRDGPLLVVAGAGSGKTRVITRRVAHLALLGVRPWRILAVTFTNKAAGEMRERIEQMAGARGVWVSTFHALCAAMLRTSAETIGLSRSFTIYDRDDQLKVVAEALKRLEFDRLDLPPGSALQAISNAKTRLESPEQLARSATNWRDERLAKVYAQYQKLLDHHAALDFDDLLMRVALLLQGDESFRQRWQSRFEYLLVDEYQDTNHAQYLIARELAAPHRNLCATGDPDQAIYSWRGATIRNILDFRRDYPDAKVVKLERNYRSTKVILRAADSLITRNLQRHERSLWTENAEGVPVRLLLADDAEEEAAQVVSVLRSLREAGRPWRDFAIFYRTNAQSRSFEETMRHAIPHRLVGAVQFYGRQEVKDVVAYLRVCLNERDELSLQRIINTPPRGIGDRTVKCIREWAVQNDVPLRAALGRAEEVPGLTTRAKNAVRAFADLLDAVRLVPTRPVREFCEHVLRASGYQAWLELPENKERLENVDEFLAKAARFDQENPEADLSAFMQEIALVSDVDNLDRTSDAVTLMTLHAAKGLEFPVVFLTGLEEGLLPHHNSLNSESEVEEERRLCYVGMTRAQEELVLSAARWRIQGGQGAEREPSRFLHEIGSDVLDEGGRDALAALATQSEWGGSTPGAQGVPGASRLQSRPLAWKTEPREPEAAAAAPSARDRLKVGDRVHHPQFGEGRIVALQSSDKLTLATVAMAGGGKRVFALEYAKLEKL